MLIYGIRVMLAHRGVGTGGAEGAVAPPNFGPKIFLKFAFLL